MPKSLYEEINELQYLRAQLRKREEDVAARTDARPLTADDERSMISFQARADDAYRDAGRFAAAPMPLERPAEYRRRLAAGLAEYSPQWAKADISRLPDDVLDIAETDIYRDAKANVATHGLRADELKPIAKRENAHDRVDWVGGPRAWFGRMFERPSNRAVFKIPGDYERASRDNMLSRIAEIVPYGQRTTVGAPSSRF